MINSKTETETTSKRLFRQKFMSTLNESPKRVLDHRFTNIFKYFYTVFECFIPEMALFFDYSYEAVKTLTVLCTNCLFIFSYQKYLNCNVFEKKMD